MKSRYDSFLFNMKINVLNVFFAGARRIGCFDVWMPDSTFLKGQFYSKMGIILDLEHPKTFNQKLQWMKLYDRNPLYTDLVDKAKVKQYVGERLGDEYIIPTIASFDSVEDIDFNKLPEQFVIKCNHDSGGLFICKAKSKLTDEDKLTAMKKIAVHMKNNYFSNAREWAYKDVDRKIIVEQYMEDESGCELKDYKIFNFNGKAKMIQVDYNRFVKHQRSMFTPEWKPMEQSFCYKTNADVKIDKPAQLEKMIEFAELLAKEFPFVRTDFYSIRDKIYFGEMTFYPEGGYGRFYPYEYDYEVGSWLELPEKRI